MRVQIFNCYSQIFNQIHETVKVIESIRRFHHKREIEMKCGLKLYDNIIDFISQLK